MQPRTRTTPGPRVDLVHGREYCRWLSQREGVPEDQMCYPPVAEILRCRRRHADMLPDGHLAAPAYRLPTEAEWEYACRAGRPPPPSATTCWSAAPQARPAERPADELLAVAGREAERPGLFDMLGNAWEWTHSGDYAYVPAAKGEAVLDRVDNPVVVSTQQRLLRGGCYSETPLYTRSGHSRNTSPGNSNSTNGFRVARTLPTREALPPMGVKVPSYAASQTQLDFFSCPGHHARRSCLVGENYQELAARGKSDRHRRSPCSHGVAGESLS